MDNYGLITQHFRTLTGLSVQQTAKKIGKSVGWCYPQHYIYGTGRLAPLTNTLLAI